MKVGLIGLGPWGRNYINTIEKINGIELNWICSPNRNLEEFSKKYRVTKNYNDILKDKQTDSVIISTPPTTHYSLIKKALLAEKDVLVEKPITLSSKEALELHHLSMEKLKVLMVGHQFLYHPAVKELKRIILNGDLGELRYFYSNRSNPEPSRSDISVLWDFAPHDISLINYLTGNLPIRVMAEGKKILKSRIENLVDISLTYPGNISSFIHLSWAASKKIRKILVVGSKKIIIFDDLFEEKLKIYELEQKEERYYTPVLDKRTPLELQCLDFLYCTTNRKKPLSDGYEGYINIKILEIIEESIKKKKEVRIDF
ncbi:MAG: Gfo/Idh/MocA family oxidoreductase [Candidatus Pacearchaeota archaeon]